MAVNLETGEWLEAEGDILAIPNSEEPLVTVYPGALSDSGWRHETSDGQIRDASQRRGNIFIRSRVAS